MRTAHFLDMLAWGFVLAAAMLFATASPASAYVRTRTSFGAPLFLPTRSLVFTPVLDSSDDLTEEQMMNVLVEAAEVWNNAGDGCTDLVISIGPASSERTSTLYDDPADGIHRIVWREFDWAGDPNDTALATRSFNERTGEISDVDINVNGVQYVWSAEAFGPTGGTNDALNMMVHEMGHAVGLSHNADPETTMFGGGTIAGEIVKRDLAADDIMGVCAIYPAGEMTSRLTAAGGLNGEFTCSAQAGAPNPSLFGFLALGLLWRRRKTRCRLVT